MGLFKRLFAAVAPARSGGPYGRYGASAFSMFAGSGRDWVKEAGPVWLNSVVGPGLSYLATQASSEPPAWAIWRGDRVTSAHPFWSVIESGDFDWSELISSITQALVIDGNAYLVKLRNERGLLTGLAFIPTGRMTARRDKDFGGLKADGSNLVTYYRLQGDGMFSDFAVNDVVHVRRGRHPSDPALGFSPFVSVLREITTDNTGGTLNAGLLKRGGILGTLISAESAMDDGEIDKAQRTELEEKLRRKTTGDMAGSWIVSPFPMKVDAVGYSPDKLMVKQMRDDAVTRICAALGVDPLVLGLESSSKTFSNLEEANESVWRKTIIPILDCIAKAFNRQVLAAEFAIPGELKADYSQVGALLTDMLTKRQAARADYLAGIITVDEARRDGGRADLTPQQKKEVSGLKRFASPLTSPNRLPDDHAFNRMVRKHAKKLSAIAKKAAAGAIAPLEFQDQFMAALEAMHSESAWYGRVRADQKLSDYDEDLDGAMGRAVSDGELGYVQGIVDRLESGEIDEETIVRRSANYCKKARGTGNKAFMIGSAGQSAKWHLGATEEHCEDCILFSELGEIPVEDYPTSPGLGETVCNVGCDCWIERSDGVRGFANED